MHNASMLLLSTCRAYFICFNNNVIKSTFIELVISYSIQWALLIYSLKRSFVLTFGYNCSIFLLLMVPPPIENQVEPSLSLKPSPLLLLQIAASLQTHDQIYWRVWSNILKRLIKYIEEVDQIYWRYWSNILKRLSKYIEEVQKLLQIAAACLQTHDQVY